MSEKEFFVVLDSWVNKTLFKKDGKFWQPRFTIT